MKLAQSQRCALCALAGLAAVQAAPALAGDDKSTWSAMMEMVGASSDEGVGKIDYSERPKLVLPPSASGLPAPRERGARSGEWPTELSAERARNVNRYARVPNAPPPEAPRPGMFARVLSFGSGAQPAAPAVEEPSRVMLTEPPPGYRRPTQDLNNLRETEVAKKSSWWNPLSWGQGGDKTAATAASAEKLRPEEQGAISTLRRLTGINSSETASIPSSTSQQSSSKDSSSWFQMPSFARGSDDTK
jgi:hypothetical protein